MFIALQFGMRALEFLNARMLTGLILCRIDLLQKPQLLWVYEYSGPTMPRRPDQPSFTSGSYNLPTPSSEMVSSALERQDDIDDPAEAE